MTATLTDASRRPAAETLAETVRGLAGWRRHGLAILAGGLATLALPPAYAAPVLWIVFPLFLWQLDRVEGRRQAFLLGWSFGFGHFLFGLYWISFALTVDLAKFGWLLPFATAGLPAVLAVYIGLVTLGWWTLCRRLALRGIAKPLAFAALWAAAEYARGHLFTGFPWNLTGYAWAGWLPILQSASVLGIYGLSLLTVAAASMPALLGEPGARRPWAAVLGGIALFVGLAVAGGARLAANPTEMVPGVTLRLVQAAIPQSLKWDPDRTAQNLLKHMRLTGAGAPGATHVIWPETAIPFYLDDPELRAALARVVPPGGVLLAGVPRARHGADGRPAYFNGMVALDERGREVAGYDKAHLVPFGEYMPLRHLLPVKAVASVAPSSADFSAGPGPMTVGLPGLPPASPLICYEVIFPGAVTTADGPRPGWLLNLTNDAWYGETAGPHQHFAIARMRAVEEGLPMVRSANTGISGVVDAHGRVIGTMGLGAEGAMDLPLPKATIERTIYARGGDLTLLLLLLCIFVAVGFLSRRM